MTYPIKNHLVNVDRLVDRWETLKSIRHSKSNPLSRNEHIYRLYVDMEHERCRLMTPLLQAPHHDEANNNLHKESMDRLDQLRSSLKLDRQKPTLLSTVVSVPRMLIMAYTMLLGSIIILLLSPLRLTHPFLRKHVNIHNNHLPMDFLFRLWNRCICTAGGISVTRELPPPSPSKQRLREEITEQPTLLMFSHVSNLDPFCLVASCPTFCKFIGKAELFLIPFFGWAAYAVGSQPISRKNRAKAVKDLRNLEMKLEKYKRSLAISPEGTRSKTGLLSEFKKGPFYLWQDCNRISGSGSGHENSKGNSIVSITPAIVLGAYELWPPEALVPASGRVVIRYCTPIVVLPDNGCCNDNDAKNGNATDADGTDTAAAAAAASLREKARTVTRSAMLNEFTQNYPADIAGLPLSSMSISDLFKFGMEYTALLLGLGFATSALATAWTTVLWGDSGWSSLAKTGVTMGAVVLIDIAMHVCVIM